MSDRNARCSDRVGNRKVRACNFCEKLDMSLRFVILIFVAIRVEKCVGGYFYDLLANHENEPHTKITRYTIIINCLKTTKHETAYHSML